MTSRHVWLVRLRAAMVLVAVAAAALLILVPPTAQPRVSADWQASRPVVRGAYHIHSSRSDGSGSVEQIAAEAAREGLDFVILTDHGDATRPPDLPIYRSGVLCLDGVEISTSGGHYVALGLPAAPYPLGGAPRAVVEDVARLGGIGIIAHPDSAKPELRWGDWETAFDGLEWLNTDSEWRDETYGGLLRLLFTYWLRPAETLASALDRPAATLDRWDRLTARRRVPALAGADAHARIGVDRGDPYEDTAVVHMPSYGASFRTFQNHVVLDAPFSRDASADGAALLAAIRTGRLFTTIDGLRHGGAFEFTGRSGEVTAQIGEYLDVHGETILEARVAAPPDSTLTLIRDGVTIHEGVAPQLRVEVGTAPGAYRVEVRLAGESRLPWLLSNPIYVGLRGVHNRVDEAIPQGKRGLTTVANVAIRDGRGESDPRSTSTITAAAPPASAVPIRWTFALADGPRGGQYAAVRFGVTALAAAEQITLRVSAERSMRAWLQLRAPAAGHGEGERWASSFYADPTERDVTVKIADLRVMGTASSDRPALDRVDALLLVADMVNSAPGTGNTLRVTGVTMEGSPRQ